MDTLAEHPGETKQAKTPWAVVLGLSAAFAFVVFFVLSRHELWRDETQAWLMATQSRTLGQLWHALRYEGHPAVWYLVLDTVATLSTTARALQITHGVIATLSVLVLLRSSPFKLWQKVLLIFGYFLAYEYAVISRSYSLGVLGLFVLCAILPTRRRTFIPIALVIAYLVNISLFTVMLSAAVCFGLVIDWWVNRGRRPSIGNTAAALAIVLVATIAAIATILPPSDSVFRKKDSGQVHMELENVNSGRLARSVTAVWRSYLPIPRMSDEGMWNSNFLFDSKPYGRALTLPLSAMLILLAMLVFARRPAVLAIYTAGTVMIVGFFIVKLAGNQRHNGHLYLLLLICFWMYQQFDELPPRAGWLEKAARLGDRLRTPFFVTVIVAQVLGAAVLMISDLRKPFSGSQIVAQTIHEHGLDDAIVVGNPAHRMSAIAAYLDEPIYFPARKEFGSYSLLDNVDRVATDEQLQDAFNHFIGQGKQVVLVVGDDPKAYLVFPLGYTYERLKNADGWSESFYVFRVTRDVTAQKLN